MVWGVYGVLAPVIPRHRDAEGPGGIREAIPWGHPALGVPDSLATLWWPKALDARGFARARRMAIPVEQVPQPRRWCKAWYRLSETPTTHVTQRWTPRLLDSRSRSEQRMQRSVRRGSLKDERCRTGDTGELPSGVSCKCRMCKGSICPTDQ